MRCFVHWRLVSSMQWRGTLCIGSVPGKHELGRTSCLTMGRCMYADLGRTVDRYLEIFLRTSATSLSPGIGERRYSMIRNRARARLAVCQKSLKASGLMSMIQKKQLNNLVGGEKKACILKMFHSRWESLVFSEIPMHQYCPETRNLNQTIFAYVPRVVQGLMPRHVPQQ